MKPEFRDSPENRSRTSCGHAKTCRLCQLPSLGSLYIEMHYLFSQKLVHGPIFMFCL